MLNGINQYSNDIQCILVHMIFEYTHDMGLVGIHHVKYAATVASYILSLW